MRAFLAPTLFLMAATAAVAEDPKGFELKSKDGKFSVTFPSKPKMTTQKVPLRGSDEVITVTNHVVEVGKSAAFIVAFNDYPDGVLGPKAQEVLKGVRDGNMGADGKLSNEKTGTFGPNKLPMREFTFIKKDTISQQDLHFRNLLILDGNRLYQVMIVAEDEKVLTNDKAKAYYASFKLAAKKKSD